MPRIVNIETGSAAPAMLKAVKGTPKAPKAEAPKAPKAEGVVTLTDAQRAAEVTVTETATAVVASSRSAAKAIAGAYALGVHAAYGLSLAKWIVRHLGAAGIATATVYYLRDIGCAYAALGEDRAERFPLEGLRTIAAKAGGDRAKIEEAADAAQGGDPEATPTLKACRDSAGTEAPTEAVMIDRIYKAALKCADQDGTVAIDLLGKALAKARNMEAQRVKHEAAMEAKARVTRKSK